MNPLAKKNISCKSVQNIWYTQSQIPNLSFNLGGFKFNCAKSKNSKAVECYPSGKRVFRIFVVVCRCYVLYNVFGHHFTVSSSNGSME